MRIGPVLIELHHPIWAWLVILNRHTLTVRAGWVGIWVCLDGSWRHF